MKKLFITLIILTLATQRFAKEVGNKTEIMTAMDILKIYGANKFSRKTISKICNKGRKQVSIIGENIKEKAATGFVICDPKLSKILALQTVSIWKKIGVEERQEVNFYKKLMDIIKSKSGISQREIDNFYAQAIEAEIMRYGKQELGKYYNTFTLRNYILKPVIEYYHNPSDVNKNKIVKTIFIVEKQNYDYGTIYFNIILRLNSSLFGDIKGIYFRHL